MTSILAVDPGPRLSAFVELAGDRILARGKVGNLDLLRMLRERAPSGPLVIEMIAPYGRIVGREVFETCVWIGRYLEAWRGVGRLLERREVKQALGLQVGYRGSTDADVRGALIVRWGGRAGKRQRPPAALAGITRDEWAALAVAVAWRERHGEAFEAVEGAPLSGLEELNRALGLLPDVTQQEMHTAGRDPVCQVANSAINGESKTGDLLPQSSPAQPPPDSRPAAQAARLGQARGTTRAP